MCEQLSKIICKRCHEDQVIDPHYPRGNAWDIEDEKQWGELHTVLCGVDEQKSNYMTLDWVYKTASTWEPPPEWCPYRFQHAVAVGRKL